MNKRFDYLLLSCLMVLALLLTSCTPRVTSEEEATGEGVVTEEEEAAEDEVTGEGVVVEEEEATEDERVTPIPVELSDTAQEFLNRITGINPSEPTSLASLLEISQELNTAQSEGAISQEEGEELGEALEEEFSDMVRNKVDAIDPTDLGALNDFWAMQRIQGLDEYESHCDPQTREYKEQQMSEKFNDWVRNWVDSIDPSDPAALKDIFFLQKIQNCKKYSDLATTDTHQYKEAQLGEKFNEWVRNAVDALDPNDPDDLSEIVFLQKLQTSEKWDEYATPETEQYKEEQLKEKFNEWVRNRVDELDPNDPNFQDELEKLRALQRIKKYEELATPETREYKEGMVAEKFDQYMSNMVSALDPTLPNFMEELDELLTLQETTIYQEFCPEEVKIYIEEQLMIKLTQDAGVLPHVRGTLPQHGQIDVPIRHHILIAFDRSMEPASVETAIEILPTIDYDIAWVLDGYIVAMLQPLEPLEYGATYTVEIYAEGMSADGLLLEEDYTFNFTTEGAGEIPRVMETLPLNGQTDAPVGQYIEIHFDQMMEPVSVEPAIVITPSVDYTIYWQEDNTIAVLQPLASLDFNTTYTVEIHTGATSAEGIPLTDDYSFSFITGVVPTPSVVESVPLDGQTGIPSNYPVEIIFSWPMDPVTTEAALTIYPTMEYTTVWREANFVLLIKPTIPLAADTTYIFTIGTEAISIDGLPLTESSSFSFTTSE